MTETSPYGKAAYLRHYRETAACDKESTHTFLMPSSSPLPAASRMEWADAAKGLCILLVVAWHVVEKSAVPFDLAGAATWMTICAVLQPVRMPLFFLVSGFFAHRAVHSSQGETARVRVLTLAWLHTVWLCLHTALFGQVLLPTTYATSLAEFLFLLIAGVGALWYLYALAVFYCLARICREWPRVVLVGACLLSATAYVMDWILPGNSLSILTNCVFFMAGCFLAPQVRRAVARKRPLRALGVVAIALMAAWGALSISTGIQGVIHFLASWVGIFGAIAFFAAVNADRAPMRGLIWLGARTLPIYVLHLPLLAVWHKIGPDMVSWPWLLQLCYPLLATLMFVAGSVALFVIAHRVRATWLFRLPPAVRRSIVPEMARPQEARSHAHTPVEARD